MLAVALGLSFVGLYRVLQMPSASDKDIMRDIERNTVYQADRAYKNGQKKNA